MFCLEIELNLGDVLHPYLRLPDGKLSESFVLPSGKNQHKKKKHLYAADTLVEAPVLCFGCSNSKHRTTSPSYAKDGDGGVDDGPRVPPPPKHAPVAKHKMPVEKTKKNLDQHLSIVVAKFSSSLSSTDSNLFINQFLSEKSLSLTTSKRLDVVVRVVDQVKDHLKNITRWSFVPTKTQTHWGGKNKQIN